ncbi:hypothetical protein [Paenibacillus arenosi]|uniref:Uncharacterized protein n=1 Tax=Paenibacillus arenosi TaxID=2774142 RepID=A0ABR9AZ32_9BACL|nr:hypothetical protein [Paenibacillus arenosi]MBD8499338.1 hypothetical protein [Paenibacillus arenosi]
MKEYDEGLIERYVDAQIISSRAADLRKLNSKCKDLFMQVKYLVTEWDPLELIADGSPNEVYDRLTTNLIRLLRDGRDYEQIYEFITRELDGYLIMGICSISEEDMEQYEKMNRDFSLSLTTWYHSLMLSNT